VCSKSLNNNQACPNEKFDSSYFGDNTQSVDSHINHQISCDKENSGKRVYDGTTNFDYFDFTTKFFAPSHEMKSSARFANPSLESSLMVLYILLRTDGSQYVKQKTFAPATTPGIRLIFFLFFFFFYIYRRLYVVEQEVRALLPRGLMDWW